MQRPLIFLLACNLVGALPLLLPASRHQQTLIPPNIMLPKHSSTQHLERVPKSAELLFTASDDDQMIHVWLPLERRIYTRTSAIRLSLAATIADMNYPHIGDYPVLPLHPTSARIVNVLGLSSESTARHRRREITCVVGTVSSTQMDRSSFRPGGAMKAETKAEVMFQESDDTVRLDKALSPLFLAEKEVESYECF